LQLATLHWKVKSKFKFAANLNENATKMHCAYVVCYFRDVNPFIYFIIPIYVHHLGLYCILLGRFLISKINIALQLTKL